MSIEEQDPFDELDPRIQEAITGIAHLGHLTDVFTFCGHHFAIRTLKTDEELLAGLVAKPYDGVIGANRAYMSAIVGLALTAVDRDTEFCPPIGPDKEGYARARFNYVTENWYSPTIEYVWARYANLLSRQVTLLDHIENLSKGDRPSFAPWLDSSVRQGNLEDGIPLDIQTSDEFNKPS